MEKFNFGPARTGEVAVYGAARPGSDESAIRDWIDFVKDRGIRRVCCLLSPGQLAHFRVDLLGEYWKAFGERNVLHAPVADFHLCDADLLEDQVLPFLADSAARGLPVTVHCWGGSGRTGHVLAAWLVRHRGLEVDMALAEVQSPDRNPKEAVDHGNATLDQLKSLLAGPGRAD